MSQFEFQIEGIKRVKAEMDLIDIKIEHMLQSIMASSLLKITELVNSGYNVFGDPFTPYSASYLKWRRKTGRTTRPNMQNTSSMMNSLAVIRRSKAFYAIGGKGTDKHGESNVAKLKKLENHKNYKILFWSDILKDIVDRYWEKLKL